MKKKSNVLLPCIFLVLVICFSIILTFFGFNFTSFADGISYSNVLDDLQQDDTFDVNEYPANDNDNSLQVIQIAESVDNELFIYVYQPSARARDLRASSINISTAINKSFSPKNYALTYLNSNGVFFKYVVNDFVLLPDTVRYYSIVSIFRPWDKNLDESTGNDNTVNEVSFEVGKLYTATTVDNVVTYTCLDTETIEITDKYVGFIRYDNGFTLYNKYCDSHYIAFSTDKPMNKLMEAEVYFIRQDKTVRINLTGEHPYSEEEPVNDSVMLSEIDKGHNSPHGWFQNSYTWQRIETVENFKQGLVNDKIELKEETEQALSGKQWVLRFYESDVHTNTSGSYSFRDYTEVTNVSILRLRFEINGVVYNLGVVDNKQSGDLLPDNEQSPWWYYLLVVVSMIVSVILVLVIVPKVIRSILGLTDTEWSVGGVIWLILKLILIAFAIMILIAAIRSITMGTIITDEFFGLFGLDSPIDFY